MGVLTRLVEFLVHATFLTAVFLIASRVPFRDLFLELRRWPILLKTLAVTVVIVPLVTAGVVRTFGVSLAMGGIMLVAAISPGDSFALMEAKSKKGNIPFAAATLAFLCVLILGFEHFSELTVAAIGSVFTAVSLALVIGYYAAGGERRDRISLGLTASLGNLAVVMLVARVSYPGAHVLHTAVVFVILRWLTILLWYIVLRFRLHRKGEVLLEISS